MIAITGASGHLGKATLHHLLKRTRPENIVAIVRDPLKLKEYKNSGIEIRIADYDQQDSLNEALKGVDQLLQISTTSMGPLGIRQENNVVKAAEKQGVKHIVYTSGLKLNPASHFFAVQQCLQTEQAIVNSGMAYTFLRNSLYMETIPQFIGNALQDGNIYFPAGLGKVSFVYRDDIAEALSKVLMEDQHQYKIYEVTGAEAFSFEDIASLLSVQKHMEITYTDIPDVVLKDELIKSGMPDQECDWFLSLAQSIKADEFSYVDDTLERIIERKPVTLKKYIYMCR